MFFCRNLSLLNLVDCSFLLLCSPGLIAALALSVVALVPTAARTQDQPPAGQPPMPDPEKMAEMVQKWKATIEPSDKHKLLEKMVGEWKTTTKIRNFMIRLHLNR